MQVCVVWVEVDVCVWVCTIFTVLPNTKFLSLAIVLLGIYILKSKHLNSQIVVQIGISHRIWAFVFYR